MRCTGFAVAVTDSISLLSRASVHMTLHISAYDDVTDKFSEILAYIKQTMGNHHKGNPLYSLKSLCSHSSKTRDSNSVRKNPFCFDIQNRHTSMYITGSCTIARSSLRKKHVVSSPKTVMFPYAGPAVAQVLEVAFGKIHVFRVSLLSYFFM